MQRLVVLLVLCLVATAAHAGWDPPPGGESTIDFLTVARDEGEHWSPVWFVVIDDQVYVRLGARAARRMNENTAAPYVKVKLAGKQYDRVKAEPAPDMAERVASAMAEKYWSDLLIRFFPHPLTMRLVPEAAKAD